MLAKEGFDVTVLEKNAGPGGRAGSFAQDGFRFDMAPSWYWMPDVFERFFNRFDRSAADFYKLQRLNPSYICFFRDGCQITVPAEESHVAALFESIEPGSGEKLQVFLKEAAYKYRIGMQNLVYKPNLSLWEFADIDLLTSSFKIDMLAHSHDT